MALDAKQRAQILRSIKNLVLSHHINVAKINYGTWMAKVDARTPELLTSEVPAFEAGVRELLTELKTSHTVFYHSLPKELLPQHTINASLRDVPLHGDRKWMFLDVIESGPAHLAGILAGDILEAVDGAIVNPPATPYFGIGQTHKLLVRSLCKDSTNEVSVVIPQRKGTKQRPPIVEPKSPTHSTIAPTLGLLKIPYFPGAMGINFANDLDDAIGNLKSQGCDRLIVDLR
ncbi:MAG: hypothetical protein ABI822_06230, partial [Bryobacteraceae bacterium]